MTSGVMISDFSPISNFAIGCNNRHAVRIAFDGAEEMRHKNDGRLLFLLKFGQQFHDGAFGIHVHAVGGFIQ